MESTCPASPPPLQYRRVTGGGLEHLWIVEKRRRRLIARDLSSRGGRSSKVESSGKWHVKRIEIAVRMQQQQQQQQTEYRADIRRVWAGSEKNVSEESVACCSRSWLVVARIRRALRRQVTITSMYFKSFSDEFKCPKWCRINYSRKWYNRGLLFSFFFFWCLLVLVAGQLTVRICLRNLH